MVHAGFGRERGYLEDLGVGVKIILNMIFKRYDMWTRFVLLMTATSDGRVRTPQ
jgi:hypothetical protein